MVTMKHDASRRALDNAAVLGTVIKAVQTVTTTHTCLETFGKKIGVGARQKKLKVKR